VENTAEIVRLFTESGLTGQFVKNFI